MATEKRALVGVVCGLFLTLSGCGVIKPAIRSEKRLSCLSIGQSREEAVRCLGKPDEVRGSGKTLEGYAWQIDDYQLYPAAQPWAQLCLGLFTESLSWWIPFKQDEVTYRVRYLDGKVSDWGKTTGQ